MLSMYNIYSEKLNLYFKNLSKKLIYSLIKFNFIIYI